MYIYIYIELFNGFCKPTNMPCGHRLKRFNMGKEHNLTMEKNGIRL